MTSTATIVQPAIDFLNVAVNNHFDGRDVDPAVIGLADWNMIVADSIAELNDWNCYTRHAEPTIAYRLDDRTPIIVWTVALGAVANLVDGLIDDELPFSLHVD